MRVDSKAVGIATPLLKTLERHARLTSRRNLIVSKHDRGPDIIFGYGRAS